MLYCVSVFDVAITGVVNGEIESAEENRPRKQLPIIGGAVRRRRRYI